jgi:tetratricopeptide (TPR) repeat protein
MNRTPWQMWDIAKGTAAEGSDTLEAITVLERAMAQKGGMQHPGLLHMYIHLMEMSPHPEKALRAADALLPLVPDAGHLVHMPTHIYVLCGLYKSVVDGNHRAIIADRKFLAEHGPKNFYSLYRCHNYHFKIYGAMFLGQLAPALEAADEMIANLPEELLRVESPPMADWLESFVPMKMHVLIRFGRWIDIIGTPLPKDRDLFCVTTAMMHYAKAVALAATGSIALAEEQAQLFEETRSCVPPSRYLFNNTATDILSIAAEMMRGEIEYRKGNFDQAFAHLRRSVELDDALPYDEPWGWMQPTRHALGALLLEQNRAAEAEAVYRADLGLDGTLARACQHPDNVWSLHGFHECLVRLGKDDEARIIKQRLDIATALADVPVKSSCFCRIQTAA